MALKSRFHRLTAKERRRIPRKSFGLPGARGKGSRGGRKVGKYPMPDAKHAAVAKGYAKKEMEAGKLSHGQYDKIVAKANRKLGERGSSRKTHRRSHRRSHR